MNPPSAVAPVQSSDAVDPAGAGLVVHVERNVAATFIEVVETERRTTAAVVLDDHPPGCTASREDAAPLRGRVTTGVNEDLVGRWKGAHDSTDGPCPLAGAHVEICEAQRRTGERDVECALSSPPHDLRAVDERRGVHEGGHFRLVDGQSARRLT